MLIGRARGAHSGAFWRPGGGTLSGRFLSTTLAERPGACPPAARLEKDMNRDEILEELERAREELLVTIEDNAISGGAGSGVGEFLAEQEFNIALLQLGLPDHFIEQGERNELLADCGLDSDGIIRAVMQRQATKLDKKPWILYSFIPFFNILCVNILSLISILYLTLSNFITVARFF